MTDFPVWYPPDDHVSYRRHFAPHFPHVFVALNSFADVSGYAPCRVLKEEFLLATDAVGAGHAVSWRRVADLCGFRSIARVNRALRGTGFRIRPELKCEADTRHLIDVCMAHQVAPPWEGHITPNTTRQIADFFSRLGHNEVIADDSIFGGKLSQLPVTELHKPSCWCAPRVYVPDRSLIVMMYEDFHYALVCQTEESRQKASPADFFEGFEADETTDDYWGIGTNADE